MTTVEFKNIGHGAAINVSGTLEHAQLSLVQSSGPSNLAGDGGVGTLVFSASTVSALPFYDSLPQDFRLSLSYRDLGARDWRTATIVRANKPLIPTTGPPVAFEVIDANESIELIGLTVPRVVAACEATRDDNLRAPNYGIPAIGTSPGKATQI